jgi:hypothetical protein
MRTAIKNLKTDEKDDLFGTWNPEDEVPTADDLLPIG